MYSIKEVSNILKINANAIRFYEKKHLITPTRKENDYREFSAEDIGRLQMIVLFRKMGFTIDAISELLSKKDNHTLLELFSAQYTALNEHIHAMTSIRETLTGCIEKMINQSELDQDMMDKMSETANKIALTSDWKDLWHFDQWAENYDRDIMRKGRGLNFYANYDQVIGKTTQSIKTGTIVEIGIGTGNLSKNILQTYPKQINYIGVDQSINMLKQAKRKCPEVEVRLGTFLTLPLKDHMADTIVTSYAFHHCNEKERQLALVEMDRVLKRTGRIVITDLMFEDANSRIEYEKNCSNFEREDLQDEFFANVDEVMAILSSLGYACKSEAIDALIWVVIAERK